MNARTKQLSISGHQPEPQPLPVADEVGSSPRRTSTAAEDKGIDGEAEGHACAAHPGAEAEAVGLTARVAAHAVPGRLEPVELLPRVTVLFPSSARP